MRHNRKPDHSAGLGARRRSPMTSGCEVATAQSPQHALCPTAQDMELQVQAEISGRQVMAALTGLRAGNLQSLDTVLAQPPKRLEMNWYDSTAVPASLFCRSTPVSDLRIGIGMRVPFCPGAANCDVE